MTLDFSPEAVQALRTDAYPAVRDARMSTADRHLRLAVHQRALARTLEDARNAARHGLVGQAG
ncbi:hypothetical protein [Deinococcus sp.]|uniref:hypothetical protein n=1 Tax=Deinococcus sp. TaxID=47478 RepID=UPI00391B56E4